MIVFSEIYPGFQRCNTSLTFMDVYCSMVGKYRNLLLHPASDGHVVRFHAFSFINNAAEVVFYLLAQEFSDHILGNEIAAS